MENIKLKIEGTVEIKLIDKETGKVVKQIKEHNAVTRVGASQILNYLAGALSTVSAWKYVNLYNTTLGDSSSTFIKSLTGSWGTAGDTGTAITRTLTATDNTTDSYTVASIGLDDTARSATNFNPLSTCYVWFRPSSAVSKASNQTLQITWTIQISYTQP